MYVFIYLCVINYSLIDLSIYLFIYLCIHIPENVQRKHPLKYEAIETRQLCRFWLCRFQLYLAALARLGGALRHRPRFARQGTLRTADYSALRAAGASLRSAWLSSAGAY